jgi:hypothetical protein
MCITDIKNGFSWFISVEDGSNFNQNKFEQYFTEIIEKIVGNKL